MINSFFSYNDNKYKISANATGEISAKSGKQERKELSNQNMHIY